MALFYPEGMRAKKLLYAAALTALGYLPLFGQESPTLPVREPKPAARQEAKQASENVWRAAKLRNPLVQRLDLEGRLLEQRRPLRIKYDSMLKPGEKDLLTQALKGLMVKGLLLENKLEARIDDVIRFSPDKVIVGKNEFPVDYWVLKTDEWLSSFEYLKNPSSENTCVAQDGSAVKVSRAVFDASTPLVPYAIGLKPGNYVLVYTVEPFNSCNTSDRAALMLKILPRKRAKKEERGEPAKPEALILKKKTLKEREKAVKEKEKEEEGVNGLFILRAGGFNAHATVNPLLVDPTGTLRGSFADVYLVTKGVFLRFHSEGSKLSLENVNPYFQFRTINDEVNLRSSGLEASINLLNLYLARLGVGGAAEGFTSARGFYGSWNVPGMVELEQRGSEFLMGASLLKLFGENYVQALAGFYKNVLESEIGTLSDEGFGARMNADLGVSKGAVRAALFANAKYSRMTSSQGAALHPEQGFLDLTGKKVYDLRLGLELLLRTSMGEKKDGAVSIGGFGGFYIHNVSADYTIDEENAGSSSTRYSGTIGGLSLKVKF